MLTLGAHLSIAGGYKRMAETAVSMNANTFQFFMRNPRGGSARTISEDDAARFKEILKNHNFGPFIVHAPYTLNPCASESRVKEFAQLAMSEDLANLERFFPDNYYNFHPGCHVGQGIETGINLTADLLNVLLKEDQKTMVLIETMSGKGTEIGSRFEEIAQIIDKVHFKDKVGICLDTCHIYSAGYDIVNHLDDVFEKFDSVIGIKKLKAIHLNDSLTPFNSKKDRHANIGEGTIGEEAIVRFINHSVVRDLPICLETPQNDEGHASEIKRLRALYTS